MKEYNHITFDEERALYNSRNVKITDCVFDGPADGESALKESSDIVVVNSDFRLRYPFWHTSSVMIENSVMSSGCRAAIWYSDNVRILNSRLDGIKAVRECENIFIENSGMESLEFGWMSSNLVIRNSSLKSEYPFLQCRNITLDNFELEGKYSFQYTEDVQIRNSRFKTKDAFWHSRNITVYDSVIEGEYLGWYSENLKFVRCRIIGTQPFCYAKGLILEDCEMVDCDLAFEKSHIQADLLGFLCSVKNPASGHIRADEIGQIILDEDFLDTECLIEVRAGAVKAI